MASVQPARDPLEIAMDFIKRINAGSADAVCEKSYADKKGKYQDQKGLTLPFVVGQEPPLP